MGTLNDQEEKDETLKKKKVKKETVKYDRKKSGECWGKNSKEEFQGVISRTELSGWLLKMFFGFIKMDSSNKIK